MRVRCVEHGEGRFAVCQIGGIGGNQSAFVERVPIVTQGEDKVALHCALEVGAERERQLRRRAVRLHGIIFAFEEAHTALHQCDGAGGLAKHCRSA
jgi:hypothetical protein